MIPFQIADFGMSRDLLDDDYYVAHAGKIPIKWCAPEVLNYRKYSTASDVWSYGCLLYEIWSLGHRPYEDATNSEVAFSSYMHLFSLLQKLTMMCSLLH